MPGEDGQVEAIGATAGETLCQRCRTDIHHHHLTCRNCGHSAEAQGRGVERWAGRAAAEAGFTDVGRTVELFGPVPRLRTALGHAQPPRDRRRPGRLAVP